MHNHCPRTFLLNILFICLTVYIVVNVELIRHDRCPHSYFHRVSPLLSNASLPFDRSSTTSSTSSISSARISPSLSYVSSPHADVSASHARHMRPMPACVSVGRRAQAFLIIFMGHSGSSAITTELRQHPQVLVDKLELVDHQPVFNTTAALSDAHAFFTRGANMNRTAGFKIRPMHILNNPMEWRLLVREFDVRIIWQHRKNLFKAAVGEYSNRYLNDKSAVEGLMRNLSRAERCSIGAGCSFRVDNFTFMHERLRHAVRSHRLITRAVQSITSETECVRELPYEDYLYNRRETMKDMRQFLGLDEVETEPERYKATGDNLCEVVSNWNEVCHKFYGCVLWQAMMEDARNGCFCQLTAGAPDDSLCAVDVDGS